MDHNISEKKSAKSFEASITLSIQEDKKFEIRFQKEQKIYCEKIKKGESKVFYGSDGWLIIRRDEKNGKLYYAFIDKTGKILDIGET